MITELSETQKKRLEGMQCSCGHFTGQSNLVGHCGCCAASKGCDYFYCDKAETLDEFVKLPEVQEFLTRFQ